MSHDEIADLRARLAQSRANLRTLELQELTYDSGDVPLRIVNGLAATRRLITDLERRLTDLGDDPATVSEADMLSSVDTAGTEERFKQSRQSTEALSESKQTPSQDALSKPISLFGILSGMRYLIGTVGMSIIINVLTGISSPFLQAIALYPWFFLAAAIMLVTILTLKIEKIQRGSEKSQVLGIKTENMPKIWIYFRDIVIMFFLGGILSVLIMNISRYIHNEWVNIGAGYAFIGDLQNTEQIEVVQFEIQKYEVTNYQYYECFLKKKCASSSVRWILGSEGWVFQEEFSNHPVLGISVDDARNYCAFIDARLPSEAEWIRAARGAGQSNYPWGDSFNADFANLVEADIGSTVMVNMFSKGKSEAGVYNMIGNAREWIDNNPQPSENIQNNNVFIAKGGSFFDDASIATLWYQFEGQEFADVGIRCAKSRIKE